MSYLIEGLILGLGLAISLGPIFIVLTETSIQKGILPGLTAGLGIWISDILFIVLFYKFISQLKETIESESFVFWLSISGAIVLISFGIYMILKKPELDINIKKLTAKNYFGFFLKGFMINTINPFTFVYWIGVISSYLIGRNASNQDSIILLSTVFFIIVISDTLKVYLANSLRNKMTEKNINYIFNFSGFVLLVFGVYMAFKII